MSRLACLASAAVILLCACQAPPATTLHPPIYGHTPATWLPKEPAAADAYKDCCIDTYYNLSGAEPFCSYIGKELTFYTPVRLVYRESSHIIDWYELLDASDPIPDGAKTQNIAGARLVGVKCHCCSTPAPLCSEVYALIEVQIPGKSEPVYAQYSLTSTYQALPTGGGLTFYTHIKRAPWEPKSAPAHRPLLPLLQQLDTQHHPLRTL